MRSKFTETGGISIIVEPGRAGGCHRHRRARYPASALRRRSEPASSSNSSKPTSARRANSTASASVGLNHFQAHRRAHGRIDRVESAAGSGLDISRHRSAAARRRHRRTADGGSRPYWQRHSHRRPCGGRGVIGWRGACSDWGAAVRRSWPGRAVAAALCRSSHGARRAGPIMRAAAKPARVIGCASRGETFRGGLRLVTPAHSGNELVAQEAGFTGYLSKARCARFRWPARLRRRRCLRATPPPPSPSRTGARPCPHTGAPPVLVAEDNEINALLVARCWSSSAIARPSAGSGGRRNRTCWRVARDARRSALRPRADGFPQCPGMDGSRSHAPHPHAWKPDGTDSPPTPGAFGGPHASARAPKNREDSMAAGGGDGRAFPWSKPRSRPSSTPLDAEARHAGRRSAPWRRNNHSRRSAPPELWLSAPFSGSAFGARRVGQDVP